MFNIMQTSPFCSGHDCATHRRLCAKCTYERVFICMSLRVTCVIIAIKQKYGGATAVFELNLVTSVLLQFFQ